MKDRVFRMRVIVVGGRVVSLLGRDDGICFLCFLF